VFRLRAGQLAVVEIRGGRLGLLAINYVRTMTQGLSNGVTERPGFEPGVGVNPVLRFGNVSTNCRIFLAIKSLRKCGTCMVVTRLENVIRGFH